MRILWLSPRAQLGGVERGLTDLVGAMDARGHECHVVLPSAGPLDAQLGNAAVHVVASNPWLMVPATPVTTWATWTLYNAGVAVPSLVRLVRRVRPDVVITETLTIPAGALAARTSGIPHVWFVHAHVQPSMHFALGRRPTLRIAHRLGDLFVVHSKSLRQHVERLFPDKRVCQIRYAVDVPPHVRSGARGDVFRAVLMAWRTPLKHQHDAVLAVHRLVGDGLDLELDLIGDGEPAYDEELRRLIRRHGLAARVRLVPYARDPFPLLAGADVALVCTGAAGEGFGRTTIEAMKLGTPVIGAAAGATVEHIRHGWNGLLYAPGDPDGLADRIADLYADSDRRREMGRTAQAWARETFTLERFADDFEAALDHVSCPPQGG